MNKSYFKLFISNLLLTPVIIYLLSIKIDSNMLTFFAGVAYIISSIVIGMFAFGGQSNGIAETDQVPAPLKKFMVCAILIIVLLLIPFGSIKNGMIDVRNNSVSLHKQYEQKCQERVSFYDKMYTTCAAKKEMQNLNKETFIQVANIIMLNRKDGEKISWKWVQENQNIPFAEFSSFYKDLSAYIETQRQGYYDLEVQCQKIAQENNTLLETFPNNIYNKFVGMDSIKYESGFTTQQTKNVFATHIEDVK